MERWGCENLMLDSFSDLETFSRLGNKPRTAEVWPAVANGSMPDEAAERGSKWGVMSAVGKRLLSDKAQAWAGVHLRTGPSVGGSPAGTMFEDGLVWNWPGVTSAENWAKGSYWTERLKDGEIRNDEYERKLRALTGQEVGWLMSVAGTVPVVGVHVHILDHAGHAWARHPGKLRKQYEHVDRLVGAVRRVVDELVIVSDHGLQTTENDDNEIGSHNFEAMFSSTIGDRPPDGVLDVRQWVEERAGARAGDAGESTYDTRDETLKDLGYIE